MLMSYSFFVMVLRRFFGFPLKAKGTVRIMVEEIRFRMKMINWTYEDFVFLLFFSVFTCSTVSAQSEAGEASTLIVLGLLNRVV